VTAICLLLAVPAWAAPSARELAVRLTLIPQSPGGGLADAPLLVAGEVPDAAFDACLDAQFATDDIASYLHSRACLSAARFAVWLYRFDEEDSANVELPSPVLVIAPDADGRFPLTAPAIVEGKLYGWQVVATIEGGAGQTVNVWSSLLYFRTAPAAAVAPELLSAEARELVTELLDATAMQRRARDGLAVSLRGMRLYGNYPSASDTYFCAPLIGGMDCPRHECRDGAGIAVPQLLKLGALMRAASRLWIDAAAGPVEEADLQELADEVYRLVNQWPEATRSAIGRKLSTLAAVAEKLTVPPPDVDAQPTSGLLSELLLAIDDLIGPGTIDGSPGYEQTFLAYAAATDARLHALELRRAELEAVLGGEEATRWVEYLRDQRAQLSLLAHEVERGRLSKAQLGQRVAEQAERARLTSDEEVRYLEGTSCHVALDRIRRLTATDTEQLARLSAETVRCYLLRLADSLWVSTP